MVLTGSAPELLLSATGTLKDLPFLLYQLQPSDEFPKIFAKESPSPSKLLLDSMPPRATSAVATGRSVCSTLTVKNIQPFGRELVQLHAAETAAFARSPVQKLRLNSSETNSEKRPILTSEFFSKIKFAPIEKPPSLSLRHQPHHFPSRAREC